jgi:hypothetical protein
MVSHCRSLYSGPSFSPDRTSSSRAHSAYLPLIPYLIYLACKHRPITLFTAANPGMPSGGLGGESKWDILTHLSKAGPFVARSDLLTPPHNGFTFPLVLKPDVGERGPFPRRCAPLPRDR